MFIGHTSFILTYHWSEITRGTPFPWRKTRIDVFLISVVWKLHMFWWRYRLHFLAGNVPGVVYMSGHSLLQNFEVTSSSRYHFNAFDFPQIYSALAHSTRTSRKGREYFTMQLVIILLLALLGLVFVVGAAGFAQSMHLQGRYGSNQDIEARKWAEVEDMHLGIGRRASEFVSIAGTRWWMGSESSTHKHITISPGTWPRHVSAIKHPQPPNLCYIT